MTFISSKLTKMPQRVKCSFCTNSTNWYNVGMLSVSLSYFSRLNTEARIQRSTLFLFPKPEHEEDYAFNVLQKLPIASKIMLTFT